MTATVLGRAAGRVAAALPATAEPPWAARTFFGELDEPRRRHPLLDAGVVLRVRDGRGRHDTAVVLRPLRRRGLPDRWFAMTDPAAHDLSVMVERTVRANTGPVDHVDVLTLTHELAGSVLGGAGWSALQRELVAEYCSTPVPFDRLALRGPIAATGWTSVLDGLPVSVERRTWPGHDAVEIAVRADGGDALLIAQLVRAALRAPVLAADALACSSTELVLTSM